MKGDPKLYVDVNIGNKGSMERIVVYEGDQANTLALTFCQTHGLNDEMQEKLVILLEQQIAGVLPKIQESDEDEEVLSGSVNSYKLNQDKEESIEEVRIEEAPSVELNEALYDNLMASI